MMAILGGFDEEPSEEMYSTYRELSDAKERIRKLEEAIRKHEANYHTGDVNDLCFENDFELYLILPEHAGKSIADFVAPEMPSKEAWLAKCEPYYCSRFRGKERDALD
jgi:sulfite reductase alpha subunit-like flavoprotein